MQDCSNPIANAPESCEIRLKMKQFLGNLHFTVPFQLQHKNYDYKKDNRIIVDSNIAAG